MRFTALVVPVLFVFAACAPDPTGTKLGGQTRDVAGKGGPQPAPKKKEPDPAPMGDQGPPPAPQGDATPTLTSVTPASITIGGSPSGVDLTLEGSRFAAGAQVDLAGVKLPATVKSDTQLTVHVPAEPLSATGVLRIAVAGKSGESNALTFTVANPTATTITQVSPAFVVLPAAAAVPLVVTGSGFAPTSIVKLNGAALDTKYVSATELDATIPATALLDAAKVSVTVSTGADVVSLPFAFELRNPSPVASSVTPGTANAGASALAVTIAGSGFTKSTAVLAGATPLATTLLSATSVRATIPSTLLANAGAVKLVASNGAPGGGTSSPVTVNVQAGAAPASTKPDCAYLCDDYGYAPGECYAGWYCIASGTYARCLAQTTCPDDAPPAPTPATCTYSCADYGYDAGACYADWTCDPDTLCLEPVACD